MKKTLIIASVMMAMIFAGCAKDDMEVKNQNLPETDRVTLTISAVTKNPEVSEAASTRISYGATDATWEAGDKIFLVKSDGTTIELTLSSGAGTTSGTFTTTDAVVAGTYTPYAVSATSITKGFVSIAAGEITLNLSAPGGGTLADALEHDILKGTAVTLTDNQASASITGLTTHMLSYLRFKFTATSKAISTIGMSSTGGINQTVTIAANGTVTGSNPTTSAINVTAGNDGANNYTGYFAVYGSTTTSLVAHAEDASGGKYSRLVSAKDAANYTAGTVYGKSFTLSDAMMTAAATGQLSSQNWKNLGLSVKWAEFNVGSSSEYDYNYNILNSSNDASGISVPAAWSGWRMPTRAEVQELFYASNRQWVTGSKNGVRFNCNDNYVPMGAGGYWRTRDDGNTDSDYAVGSVIFYINETTPSNGEYAQIWAIIGSEGTTLGFGSANLGNSEFYFYNYAPQRLVCDY